MPVELPHRGSVANVLKDWKQPEITHWIWKINSTDWTNNQQTKNNSSRSTI